MATPPILAAADNLVKNGKHFTEEAFASHKGQCGVEYNPQTGETARQNFMRRVTLNLAEKYTALEALTVPENLKADKA